MSLKWLVYHAVQAFDTEEVARAAASADVGRMIDAGELLSNVRGLRVQHGTAEKLVRRLTDAFDDEEALIRFPLTPDRYDVPDDGPRPPKRAPGRSSAGSGLDGLRSVGLGIDRASKNPHAGRSLSHCSALSALSVEKSRAECPFRGAAAIIDDLASASVDHGRRGSWPCGGPSVCNTPGKKHTPEGPHSHGRTPPGQKCRGK